MTPDDADIEQALRVFRETGKLPTLPLMLFREASLDLIDAYERAKTVAHVRYHFKADTDLEVPWDASWTELEPHVRRATEEVPPKQWAPVYMRLVQDRLAAGGANERGFPGGSK